MPEGDTVFKLAAFLRPELLGCALRNGSVYGPQRKKLDGFRVSDVYAHGKHLFIEFDGRRLLRSHLGMWGSWHSYAPDEPWQKPAHRAAIILDIGERLFVCFHPLQVEMLRHGGVSERRIEATLGPDLLAAEVDMASILARVHALGDARAPVVDLLLDQRIASGIGNVYKSEVLFLERIEPDLVIGRLDDKQVLALYRCARRLLRANIRGGPRITRRAADEAGSLWVYGRTGQRCLRCDGVITSGRIGRGLRSTFWCPSCQARADTPADAPELR